MSEISYQEAIEFAGLDTQPYERKNNMITLENATIKTTPTYLPAAKSLCNRSTLCFTVELNGTEKSLQVKCEDKMADALAKRPLYNKRVSITGHLRTTPISKFNYLECYNILFLEED